MNSASININLETDSELIRDFVDSVEDSCEIIEAYLATVIDDPTEIYAVDEIFRHLHTMKGNAGICGFGLLEKFIHSIENITTDIRDEHLVMTPHLGEMLLLMLDKLKQCSTELYSVGSVSADSLEEYQHYIDVATSKPQMDIDAYAESVISHLTGKITNPIVQSADSKKIKTYPAPSESLREDLLYARELAIRLEKKISYWDSRSENILSLVVEMNLTAGNPVDPTQLEMAVYTHDLGMAFLPHQLLHLEGKFNAEDKNEMGSHVTIGSGLLSRFNGWGPAVEMVAQHHERVDGSGYPNGLVNDDICNGAKLLAIADAYESMTHPRPDRAMKRSILRAVKEINTYSGIQFCSKWVDEFNKVIRERYSKSK